MQDEAILYLHPNKKETAAWFQALGRSTPVGGTKFGLIQTIAQAQEKNKRFRADEGIPKEMKAKQHSIDLLAEVNEGIAAEQKRKAEKVAETMDYGNPRAMKRRAGEESYVQPESDTKNSGDARYLPPTGKADATADPAAASTDLPDRASVDTTAENKRFEPFVDIVAQVFGKNNGNVLADRKHKKEPVLKRVPVLLVRKMGLEPI